MQSRTMMILTNWHREAVNLLLNSQLYNWNVVTRQCGDIDNDTAARGDGC